MLVVALLVAAVACGEDGGPSLVGGIEVPDGLQVDTAVEGLSGPTQIASDGDGGFVVAELNGGEGDGSGRVLRFGELATGEAEVLVEGLLTPTGVVVDEGGQLWIMEQRRLTVGPLDDPSDRRVVLDDLPFNGRSEGTVSAVPGGGILYDTSGARDGDRLVEGSGTLWYLADADADPVAFATGFKHAYAHAPAGDGRWFVTEISDGVLNGGAPQDELVVASAGDDFGYPRCIGDNEPVQAFDVTEEDCSAAPSSHALLGRRSTPTSVAVAPWDDELVLVALWSGGEVVGVPVEPDVRPHEPDVVVDGIGHPQHLLVDGDRLLVVDHTLGRILVVTRVA